MAWITVLYVEDNIVNATLVQKMLRREDIDVIVAETARDGVDAAFEHLPDLILMDYNLPDVNGIEAMKYLKQQPTTANMPVMMLTADASADTRAAASRAGCDGYLLKPISKRALVDAISGFAAHA
jgi:CheY-like chemotaxis protein